MVPAVWPGERYWVGLPFIHGCVWPFIRGLWKTFGWTIWCEGPFSREWRYVWRYVGRYIDVYQYQIFFDKLVYLRCMSTSSVWGFTMVLHCCFHSVWGSMMVLHWCCHSVAGFTMVFHWEYQGTGGAKQYYTGTGRSVCWIFCFRISGIASLCFISLAGEGP